MATAPTRILLVEYDPGLRELEEMVLREAAYQVEVASPTVDPVPVAEQTSPTVIVVGIRPGEPAAWDIVDRLRLNPTTRVIPIVVVSTSEQVTVEAVAAPNVRETIVAPYDIDALRAAIARAVGNPPPAAVLPKATRPVPPTLIVVTEALLHHARTVILRTIVQLQGTEPYAARFPELSTSLIDDLPVIFGAIVNGLQRGLSPSVVFAVPAIHQSIERHVTLRQEQGLGVAAAIDEYHVLRDEMVLFLRGLVGEEVVTALDAYDVHSQVDQFFAHLVTIIVETFCPPRPKPPKRPSRTGDSRR